MHTALPVPIDANTVDTLFQNTLKSRKGEFALELAAVFAQRLEAGTTIIIPGVIDQMFGYLFEAAELDNAVTDVHEDDYAGPAD